MDGFAPGTSDAFDPDGYASHPRAFQKELIISGGGRRSAGRKERKDGKSVSTSTIAFAAEISSTWKNR